MKRKLLQCTLAVAVLPFSGLFLILMGQSDVLFMRSVLVVTTLLQLPVVLLCKHLLRPYIDPDPALLERMGIPYVPAAYDPRRYRIDVPVAETALWGSLLGPALAWLAVSHPRENVVAVLNDFTYVTPSMTLLLFAVAALLLGIMAFPLWFELARARAIFSQSSDRKRYLLRGFAEHADKKEAVRQYQTALRHSHNL